MNTTLQPIINDVLSLQSFSPSKTVNKAMGSLVHAVVDSKTSDAAQIASTKQILKVRSISAETESELEKFWARLIIASDSPLETLASFPYLDNYEELTKREVQLLKHSGLKLNKNQKALIVGSGPLPLSAYELHRQTGIHVDHVDSSEEAIELSRKLMERLHISSKYYASAGETVKLTDTYDLILIAALAGSTAADKQNIINAVLPHLTNDGRIVLRSAKGSRTLLYPGIESNQIKGIQLLEEYHPTDYIINSIFVYGRYYETRFIFN